MCWRILDFDEDRIGDHHLGNHGQRLRAALIDDSFRPTSRLPVSAGFLRRTLCRSTAATERCRGFGRHLELRAIHNDFIRVVPSEAQELPQELAPDRVRGGRRGRLRRPRAVNGDPLHRRATPAGVGSSPAPSSPTISIKRPFPERALASPSRINANSASRPINGSRSSETLRAREPMARPTDHALTGSALPFTANGASSDVLEDRVRAIRALPPSHRSIRAPPCAIRRAARLTASPITVYVRR